MASRERFYVILVRVEDEEWRAVRPSGPDRGPYLFDSYREAFQEASALYPGLEHREHWRIAEHFE